MIHYKLAKKQSGQALLIVILAMVVSLTVGLSIASQSIINLRTSSEEASSQKALSAAEAGIERIIANKDLTITDQQISVSTGTTIKNASSNSIGGTSFELNGGSPVLQDDGIDIWVTEPSDPNLTGKNPALTIYWDSSADDCNSAAIEVKAITGTNKTNPVLKTFAFDPCLARKSDNSFNENSVGPAGTPPGLSKNYPYTALLTSADLANSIVIRVIPLYKNASIAVSSSIPLPTQGSVIESTGQSGNTERKITVFKSGYSKLPNEFFSYSLFSP